MQRLKGQGEGFYEGSPLSHGFIFSGDWKEWVTEGTSHPIGAWLEHNQKKTLSRSIFLNYISNTLLSPQLKRTKFHF